MARWERIHRDTVVIIRYRISAENNVVRNTHTNTHANTHRDSNARIPVAQTGSHRSRCFRRTFRISHKYGSLSYRDIAIIARRFRRECSSRSQKTNGYLSRGNLCRSEIWRKETARWNTACKVCPAGWKLRFQPRYTYCLDREPRYSCKSRPRSVPRRKVTAFRKCSEISAARRKAKKNWKGK